MRTGKWGSVGLASAVLLAACAEPTTTPSPRPRPQQVINGGLPTASAAPGTGFDAVNSRSAPPALASVAPSLAPSPSPKSSASPSADASATTSPSPSPSASAAASSDPNASGTGGGTGLLGGNVTVSKLVGGAAGHAEGTESQALFSSPTSMALDITVVEGLRLYVADRANFRIRRVLLTPSGNVDVDTYAGMGVAGDANASTAATATFRDLRALACGNDGALYVVDGSRIRRIAPNGGEVVTIAGAEAGRVPAATTAGAEASGSAARFQAPASLVTTSFNTLLVADTGNHRIMSVDLAQGQNFRTTPLAGTGSPGFSPGNDLESLATLMDAPCALAVDVNGLAYFADRNHRIRSLTLDTFKVNLVAGAPAGVEGGAQGQADGTALSTGAATGRFDFTLGAGLATYPNNPGTLYVVEPSTNRLRIVHQGQLKTLAGDVAAGSAEGAGNVARFNAPSAVVYNSQRLLVLDSGNHRIRLVLP